MIAVMLSGRDRAVCWKRLLGSVSPDDHDNHMKNTQKLISCVKTPTEAKLQIQDEDEK